MVNFFFFLPDPNPPQVVNILNAESEIYFLGFRDKDKITLIYELLWSSKNLEAVIANVYIYVSCLYV